MKFNFIISEEINLIAAFDVISGDVKDIYNEDYKKEVCDIFTTEKITTYKRIINRLGYTYGAGKKWPSGFSLNEFMNFSDFENYFCSIKPSLEKQKDKLEFKTSLFSGFIEKVDQFLGIDDKNSYINVFLVDAPMAGGFIEFGIIYSAKLGIPSLLCLAHEYLHLVLGKKFKELLTYEVSEIMEENLINKILVDTGLWNDLILNSYEDAHNIIIDVPLVKLDEKTEKLFTEIVKRH